MSTDRISRLQSLLDRIKKNAALPKRRLGSKLFSGGTQAPRSDVATGPAVPAAAIAQTPVEPRTTRTLPPVAPVLSSTPQAIGRIPTLSGAARVPTMSGGRIATPHTPEVVAKPPEPPEVIEELDLDEADVVDITSDRPPPAEVSSVEVSQVVSVDDAIEAVGQSASDSEGDELRWSEPPAEDRRPPDSSPRPRTAASLNEALADAVADADVPIKTPPPESGRQPMDGVYAAPIPERADFVAVPTVEQLGETLELEAPTSAKLELDLGAARTHKAKEELEFELPPRPSVLEPPQREELPVLAADAAEPTSRRPAPDLSQILNVPDDADTVITVAMSAEAAAPSTDRDDGPLTAEVTSRKVPQQAVVAEFVLAARRFAPSSFAELLDASLKLGSG
jgi:hypothetical protein